MANTQAVGGPAIPQTEANPAGGMVPFRRATTGRTSLLPVTGPQILTAASQPVQIVVDGSGYIYSVDLDINATGGVNGAAATAVNEDAPYNVLSSVVFGDVNGELINLDGYSLFLANLYGGWSDHPLDGSVDSNIFSAPAVTGAAGAKTGDFHFHLSVPIALNRRSLLGLVANQDRAQKYTLRSDIAPSSVVFSTPPDTTLPSITITRTYDNYAVPAAQNANQAPQQQVPPKFGVLHFLTQSVSPSAPAVSSTIQHMLPRLGNTIRMFILVFRGTSGSRATAEANLPTRISLKLGDTPIFTETVAYRRALMFARYGFDAPDGVLVYDFITDVINQAGAEMGEDYAFTNGLVNAQFEVTYPSAGWGAGSSLTVITDDLVIPSNVDIYAPDA